MALNSVAKITMRKLLNQGADITINSIYGKLHNTQFTDRDLVDFLIDDIHTLILSTNDGLNVKKFGRYLMALNVVLERMYKNDIHLDFYLTCRILSLGVAYQEVSSNQNVELSGNILELINSIENYLPKSFKPNEIVKFVNNQSILEKQVNEYETSINSLQKEIQKKSQQLENNESELQKKNDEISKLKENITPFQEEIKEKSKENDQLKNAIEQRDEIIADLTRKQANVQVELESLQDGLSSMNMINEELNGEVIELQKEVKEKATQIDALTLKSELKTEKRKIEEKLDCCVIDLLYKNRLTAKELLTQLNNTGISVSDYQLSNSLKRIQRQLSITNYGHVALPKIYTVQPASIVTGSELTFDYPKDYMDILVVSDMHLKSFDESEITDMNILYEYAAKNNVNYILNLGDLLGVNNVERDINELLTYRNFYDKIINDMPRDENITHIIMGGNHDKNLLKLGIDPIKYIADNRTDIIQLGYTRAQIHMGKLDTISLYHPETRYTSVVDGEWLNSDRLVSELDKDVFINLVAHIHSYRMDSQNNLCIVPSYGEDRLKNSALHMRIFFKEMGGIDYIVIKQLIKNEKLTPISETIHQKKLIR